MKRATICIEAGNTLELEAYESWLAKWRPSLTYVSDNQGCGCCIDLWDVEGADDAISEIPSPVRCASAWADSSPNAGQSGQPPATQI